MIGAASAQQIMRKAYEKKILIPAFNVAYLPMMKPVVRALVDLETFGLVEVARVEVEKFESGSFAAVAQEYKTFAQRLENRSHTRLHMDHIPVIDEDGTRVDWKRLIQEGLDLKYDSVMIDGSRLSLEENIETTRQVVKMVHARGTPVEAELGAVLGHEKELTMTYEEIYEKKVGFTNPDEARAFVDETDVDWLSVAVGNIHGAISGVAKDKDKVKARLDIAHLSQISEA
ncbi:class II fructose-bisphosphate aldolase, partial [[Eubacterium] cellulosolvens]